MNADERAQLNALKPCAVCGQPVGRIVGTAGRGRVTCGADACNRKHRSLQRKYGREWPRMTGATMSAERERRKRLAEQHDGGYTYVCRREDMWDWGEQEPQSPIRMFSVMDSELEVLASPWSWPRRRRIVKRIKRESRQP